MGKLFINKHAVLQFFILHTIVLSIYPSPFPSLYAQEGTEDQVSDVESISLKFPENMELKVLIEYVSERLNVNIIYDHHVDSKRITIKSPKKIHKDSLIELLVSVLRMNGLILVDSDQDGWKRIVADEDLIPYCTSIGVDKYPKDTTVISQIIELKHINAQQADQFIKPFLSKPGGNMITMDNLGMVILTDYANNIDRILKIIKWIDQPHTETDIAFIQVKNLEASQLTSQITKILLAKTRHEGTLDLTMKTLEILPEERTNQLIMIGKREVIDETLELVASLDVPLGLETRVYPFQVASPERVDQLIKNLIGDLASHRLYKSAVDLEGNLLVVTTTPEIHEQLAVLKADVDQPIKEEQIPIRFYKLQNAKAGDVLMTIRLLEGYSEFPDATLEMIDSQESETPSDTNSNTSPASTQSTSGELQQALFRPNLTEMGIEGASKTRVMADKNTNTIIVIAEPAVQRIYEKLIEKLDCRRPQVLIEVSLVVMDTSEGYSFGVDISTRVQTASEDGKYLFFSSFGLSEIDPDSGGLEILPGVGFNGVLIDNDIADIVIQALETEASAKVLSSPRLLVNDNATGTLTAVNEVPYTSINASDTVATTSFSGFSSAGTTITVTPHISEGDHLSLEYTINLSSFSGEGSEGIPPPRQTDEVQSEVTVPHGQTIIIGGLKRFDATRTRASIPILGDLPLIGPLFGKESENESESSLFVFIRPIILRDDEFRDLKYLSSRDAEAAGISDGYPKSTPMVIR